MPTLGTLIVKVDSQVEGALAGTTKVEKALVRLGDRATRVGRTVSIGVTLPILAAGAAATKAAIDFESLEAGLAVLTGSAEEAERQLARLRVIAELPGINFEQATSASIGFQAIGKSAEFAERMIRGVANAVALSPGGGPEEFGNVMRQIRQVSSLGRLMGEELNVIIENAPVMARAIQEAFGTTSAEAIRKLGLTSDQFFERLMDAMETLPVAAVTSKVEMENMFAALKEGAAAVGDTFLPIVVQAARGVTEWAKGLRQVNPEILQWGVGVAAAAALAGPLLVVVGGLTRAYVALKVAGIAALPFLGIGGAVAIGLSALAALWVKNKLEAAEFAGELDRVNDAAERLRTQVQGLTDDQLRSQITLVENQLANLRAAQGAMGPGGSGAAIGMAFGAGFGAEATAAEITRLEERLTKLKGALNPLSEPVADVVTQTGLAAEGFLRLRDPLAAVQGEIESLREKAEDLRLELALEPGVKEAKKLQNELKAAVGLMEQLKRVEGDIRLSTLRPVDSTTNVPGLPAGPIPVPEKGKEREAAFAAIADMLGPLKELFQKFKGWALLILAAIPVVAGLFAALKPALQALAQPLRDIGAIIASVLTPILEALTPVLESLREVFVGLGPVLAGIAAIIAVVLTPIVKGLAGILRFLANVVSLVVEGLGYVVRFIGDLIEAIPGVSTSLDEVGQDMIDAARKAREAGFDYEDAGAAARALTESMIGAIQGFKIAQYRFDAAQPMAPAGVPGQGGGTGGGGGGERPDGTVMQASVSVNIQTTGDGRETYRAFYDEFDQRTRGAGTAARALFDAMPVPA